MRLSVAILCLSAISQLPLSAQFRPSIPRAWDDAELAAWTIPPQAPGVFTVYIPASRYYKIASPPIYKTYPIYHPAKEPAGYMDWLKQQEPQIAFDASKLESEADWIAAGKLVFEGGRFGRDPTPDVRNPDWYEKLHIPLTTDGIVPGRRYVIRSKGTVEVSDGSCSACHTRVMPDGTLRNGPQTNFPLEREDAWRARIQEHFLNGLVFPEWNKFKLADGPMEKHLEEYAQIHEAIPPGVNTRSGVSVLTPPKVADLIGVKDRKYLDLISRVQHRNIGDMMRYSSFLTGQNMFYSSGKELPEWVVPETFNTTRFSDEQTYALALYIYSLEPPPNPNRFDEVASRGQRVFEREGCSTCHKPPLYTNNKLTLAGDFKPTPEARAKYDIMDVRVGTDPRSSMGSVRGTGYYKVPSLKGVWYRGPFEHNGSVASLEDWFDAKRLRDDYVPTGFVGYGVKTRAVKGHQFGLQLSVQDKHALIAFLKTL
jgi:hypothetical protein